MSEEEIESENMKGQLYMSNVIDNILLNIMTKRISTVLDLYTTSTSSTNSNIAEKFHPERSVLLN